ncbi:hypothetical protein PCC7424_2699 [Gloeothece citriformis PCC 7424]|uniref:Uncharacterized protein n=2 Tax=Gloeothece TaxID=28070 RepID=B7K7R5_GLOC7|nr:hypothetical protein PCC7424_2699 [Gloeothece citriformis PCC 7424]
MRRGRILQFEREDCGVKCFRIGISGQFLPDNEQLKKNPTGIKLWDKKKNT